MNDQQEEPKSDILVVDDRRENLTLLQAMLSEEGYRVRPVRSGEAALTAVQACLPDLILMDISMPGMSGFDVCRELRKDERCAEIPVIFVTALQEKANLLEAFEVGGADFLTKPFQVEEVLARVRTHLQIHELTTKLHRQNDALSAAHEKLLDLQKSRDMLTHMIVHDLRSPLAGILGSLQFMEEDAGAGDGKIQIGDVKQALVSSKKLMAMINDLLDISRLEVARLPLKLARHDAASIISSTVSLLGPEKSVVVQTSSTATTPVECDRSLMERVLLNLIDNALKYAPRKSPINLTADSDSQGCLFRVEDRGPGIPDEYKELIFDKFRQVDARKNNIASSGLGLTFCKLAVESHGGSIHVTDREGGGSSFELRLPFEAAAQ